MTAQKLMDSAEHLRNSKFNNGEQILFCVDYSFLTHRIHSKLYSTAEKAVNFFDSLPEDGYKHIYPVFDIWHNPKQVD